ncbi:MAG: putative terminase large subunit [Prokaryotic dsDNA virus sp.]|nr:MAG: putative terminase large subunit [Prokaryotic dsDNA virus sp.]
MDSSRVTEYCNKQFYQLVNSDKRITILQGGARSGKTYSCCQYLVYRLTTSKKPMTITIIRDSMPSLKRSVMRDFFNILDKLGLYTLGKHNKSESTWTYNGSVVQMLGADDPAKLRGAKHDIAFINEANTVDYETYRQIAMRTTEKIIIDFNPSEAVSWLYSELIDTDSPDIDFHISTWRDNKFLPQSVIDEIEKLKSRDEDYYNVFGLGQRAVFTKRQIYTTWQYIDYVEFPDIDYCLGLDFGYSQDCTGIVKVGRHNDKLYVKEICYRKGMTNKDIANFIKEHNLEDLLIVCDSAEPKSIEELRREGLMVKPSIKGAGSVNAGISKLKEFEVFISKCSKNIFKEQQGYLWEELKDGTIINKPITSAPEHLLDALRYAVYTRYKYNDSFFIV